MALIQIKHVYSIAQVYGSWFGLIHMNGSYKYDPFGKTFGVHRDDFLANLLGNQKFNNF